MRRQSSHALCRYATIPAYQYTDQPGCSLNLSISEFLSKLHYIGMMGELMGRGMELNL